MPHVVEAPSLNQCTAREVYLCLSYLSVYVPTSPSLYYLSIQPSMHLTVIYISAFASIHHLCVYVCIYLTSLVAQW